MSDATRSAAWLVGGGEMGELVRATDWSRTPLGPIASWPQDLRTAVRILLDSRFPMFIWWGAERTNIYNDAYIPVLGARHPSALGRAAASIWAEIWDVVGPQSEVVLREGRATWNESVLLLVERYGFIEETYFTFSYSPVRDDSGRVSGLFCACTEDTARVLSERRLENLRLLGERSLAGGEDVEQVCRAAAEALEADPRDFPFALVYLLDEDGRRARLRGRVRVPAGSRAAPEQVLLAGSGDVWGFGALVASGSSATVERLGARFGSLPAGDWAEATTERALVLPLSTAGTQAAPAGFLVAGLSPRLAFGPEYRSFLELAAGQIATALAKARALEQEKRRAESLTELDRAKTTFFSNVSHEFRTPLTLMLAPLEDALGRGGELPSAAREQLVVAHRNSLRLLKLVNSLLDFSRIEAGRVQATYEPTDLAELTADLASNFRSACERAGIELRVDCPPLPEPIHVDRDMWEKIVLNLLSNAFKFTFAGAIEVRLRPSGADVELRVSDTGVGIPRAELPRVFERFHRVEGTRGRTHEGTGIGLALVQELVKLHGGRIEVESEPGRGTSFRIAVPRGSAHLPPELVDRAGASPSTTIGASAYVEEALRWLPGDGERRSAAFDPGASSAVRALSDVAEPKVPSSSAAGRILLADDNADMRDYVARLLSPRFEVEAVPDGEAALAAIRRSPPDLVLSDVMMPGLDGFELLQALRVDARTRSIPVILLSARAGEESRLEGFDAGADDYLVKPFGSRELIARVESRLEMARIRREGELRFREAADAAPAMLWITDAQGRCSFLSRSWYEFTGQTEAEALGFGWTQAVHPEDRERARQSILARTERLEPYTFDYRLRRADGAYRWVIDSGRPRLDEDGRPYGYIGSVIEVHERKEAEQALRESQQRLRSVSDHVAVLISYIDRDLRFGFANAHYEDWLGVAPEAMVGRSVRELLGEDIFRQRLPYFERVLRGETVQFEAPTRHRRLGLRETELALVPDFELEGGVRGFYVRVVDITDRKRTEHALLRQGERLRLLWEAAGIMLTSDEPDTMLQRVFTKIRSHLRIDTYFNFMVEEGGAALRLASYSGIREEEALGISRLDFGQAICGTVAVEQRPIVATSIQGSDDPKARIVKGYGIRVYACNPLIAGGRLLGTLSFASRTRDEFDPDELEFLETISHYVTAAYQQMRLIAQLRDADRRKDEFLATLAHELRNPLAPIRSGLQVLRLAKDDPDVAEQSLAIMERQSAQLTRLIDDLLDVSRITRGRLQVRRAQVELADVVQSALEVARPFVEEARHELRVELPDHPIVLQADLMRLAQVFSNLLSNAAKYTPPGGTIRLFTERSQGEIAVTVADNGLGIPANMLERIFEMFHQIDRPVGKGYQGLGIGLTLVKSLVEMHGGRVEAKSDGPGRGSAFTVHLPCAVPAAVADAPPPAREQPAEPQRVLVVDDNVDAAEMLGLSVELLGNEVRTAHEGATALEIAAAFRPDVVLMDLGMPGMSGYEAARFIRSQPWGARITLVALTGWGQDEDRRRTREAGFDHHLVKPADHAALEAILRACSSAR